MGIQSETRARRLRLVATYAANAAAKAATAEIESCKQQREYLQKTLVETEANIKELLQGNEALSRELLQNGYQ